MDLRRLRAGEWIAALSGAALIVSLWLPWWRIPTVAFELPAGGGDFQQEQGLVALTVGSGDLSAWSVLSVIDVLLAALGVLAIGLLVLTATARTPGPGLLGDALLVPVALVMLVVCLVRVLNVPGALELPSEVGVGAETRYGAWVGLAACVGVLVGALVAMRDERLSRPGRPTDQTGAPLRERLEVETLPGSPPA